MGDCISWCNPVFKRVDKLPSVRQATRNHTYITPDGKKYILNATGDGYELLFEAKIVDVISKDNTIIVAKDDGDKVTTFNLSVSKEIMDRITELENREDKDTIYDDTAVVNRITTLENKEDKDTTYTAGDGIILDGTTIRLNRASLTPDKYVKDVAVSRKGKKITLSYTYTDDTVKSVEFDDEDTITLAYDDTALRERIEALENKPDNDTIYDDRDLKARLKVLEDKPDKDTTYTAGKGLELVGNEFRALCSSQNLAVRYADDLQGTGFRETDIAISGSNNLLNSLTWVVEQANDPKANGNKLVVETTDDSMKISGGAVAGIDFVYARLEAEPNTEFTVSFDYTSGKTWGQYIDYLYFVADTSRTSGADLKNKQSIKLPKPDKVYDEPQHFSMDFTVGEQGYIYLYVNHTNSHNYAKVEQTFSNFTIQPKNAKAQVGERAKYIGIASVCPDGTDPEQPNEYTWISLYNETDSKTLEELRKQIESNQVVVNQQINQALTELGEQMVANNGKAYKAGAGISISEDGVISNDVVDTNTRYSLEVTNDGVQPTFRPLNDLNVTKSLLYRDNNSYVFYDSLIDSEKGSVFQYDFKFKDSTSTIRDKDGNKFTVGNTEIDNYSQQFIASILSTPARDVSVDGYVRYPQEWGFYEIMVNNTNIRAKEVGNINFHINAIVIKQMRGDSPYNDLTAPVVVIPLTLENLIDGASFGVIWEDGSSVSIDIGSIDYRSHKVSYRLREV